MQYLLLIHSDEKAMQTAARLSRTGQSGGLWRLHEGDGQMPG